MALVHSPKIVTDGLSLYFDAANTKSYPGSGTTWTDMTGGLLGTIDGATYDNGTLSFDGTNDRVTFNAGSIFGFGTGKFSIEFWVNSYHDGGWARYFTQKTSGGTSRVMISISGSSEKFSYYSGNDSFFSSNSDNIEYPVNSWSGWRHIIVTRESTSSNGLKLYINGDFISSGIDNRNYPSDGTSGYIGSWESTEYMKMKLGSFRVYKGKALTEAEIKQNYNAHKGRFGL